MKILVVDDEESQRKILASFLNRSGYTVMTAESGKDAIDKSNRDIDLVLLDMRLGDMSGMQVMNKLLEKNPLLDVIIITAYGTIEQAVSAMKKGAFEYLSKPINLNELLVLIEKVKEKRLLKVRIQALEEELDVMQKSKTIIAESNSMKDILREAMKIAQTDAPVLITGESGTGKEVIARFIHVSSKRLGRFIPISCAAIPENLLESELFGYEKGAFSGADKSKPGKIELAEGGTLFLDEIGEMKPELQAKLLRVLQSYEIERLGSTKSQKVNVRIIAATNRDVEELVEDGKFRQDLYYRLNVVRLHIPPLRERRSDIVPLCNYFLKFYTQKYVKRIRGFTKDALACMLSYKWPGNVRELSNVIERAVLLASKNLIAAGELAVCNVSEKKQGDSLRLEDVERAHIKHVLEITHNNIKEAARLLGIHRNTLSKKLRQFFPEKFKKNGGQV